jgi:hypothetical protein
MVIVIDKNNLLNNILTIKDNQQDVQVLEKMLIKIKKNLFKFLRNITGEGMKEPNSMGKDMDMELFIIVKVGNMLEIGNLIKCMGKVFFIIQIIRLLMMVNGRMINFRVMGRYSMSRW